MYLNFVSKCNRVILEKARIFTTYMPKNPIIDKLVN